MIKYISQELQSLATTCSVDVRDDTIRHYLFVAIPVFAVSKRWRVQTSVIIERGGEWRTFCDSSHHRDVVGEREALRSI